MILDGILSKLLNKLSPRHIKGPLRSHSIQKALPKAWMGIEGDSVDPCPWGPLRLVGKTDSSQLNITQGIL